MLLKPASGTENLMHTAIQGDSARGSGPVNESRRSRAVAALVLLVMLGAALAVLSGVRGLAVRSTSMAPTLPVGSLALTMEVDAADVRVGDVVRLRGALADEPGRVVEMSAAGEELVVLTVRGDGDSADGPATDVVPSVDQVLVAVPFAGYLVSALTSGPGLVVLGASVLVLAARPNGHAVRPRPGTDAGAAVVHARSAMLIDPDRPRASY